MDDSTPARSPESVQALALRRASLETHRDTGLTAALMTAFVLPHTLVVVVPAVALLATVGGRLRALDLDGAESRVLLGRAITLVALVLGVVAVLWWFGSILLGMTNGRALDSAGEW
jgi:hypothetical protein